MIQNCFLLIIFKIQNRKAADGTKICESIRPRDFYFIYFLLVLLFCHHSYISQYICLRRRDGTWSRKQARIVILWWTAFRKRGPKDNDNNNQVSLSFSLLIYLPICIYIHLPICLSTYLCLIWITNYDTNVSLGY